MNPNFEAIESFGDLISFDKELAPTSISRSLQDRLKANKLIVVNNTNRSYIDSIVSVINRKSQAVNSSYPEEVECDRQDHAYH